MNTESATNMTARNSAQSAANAALDIQSTRMPDSHWFPVRKQVSIRVKQLLHDTTIETLEGPIAARAGDFWCRGAAGEQWAQTAESLRQKYRGSGQVDAAGWERYDPAPDAPALESRQLQQRLTIESRWGRLHGKAGDYLVRRQDDHGDLRIVDKHIFESTYQVLSTESSAQASSDRASCTASSSSPPVNSPQNREHASDSSASFASATETTNQELHLPERHSA